MPTFKQDPEVSFDGYLLAFAEEAKKQQTKQRADEVWDRYLPGGEIAHRLLVEPATLAFNGVEKFVSERSVRAKSALVLGAAALSTGLGVLAAARRSS